MIKFPTGQGLYNLTAPGDYVDTFAPDELMSLQTFVLFNGAPVANELVTFVVASADNPTDV